MSFVVIGVVIAALAGFYSVWNNIFGTDAQTVSVGDCMKNSGTDADPDMETVDCGAADAEFEVAEVHESTSDLSQCDRTKYSAYAETSGSRRHRSSVVLCLKDK
ncbi:hypothetical protein ACFV3R_01680 [Streptomyces sp. NPDC059740]|uniref:LppU/SCO3897 family protein n=1 Tax=Streptomyces sp. NPDC059740 TaxID=3346926 RepID=UPI00364B7427